MTLALDTQMTLALLQKLLMALWANDMEATRLG